MLIKNPYEHVLKTTEAENINPQKQKAADMDMD